MTAGGAPRTLTGVFVGTPAPLAPEGQPSAIVKHPVDGPVAVSPLGLAGDEQGDPRVHGGPQKAVHVFPPEHYATLVGVRPALAGRVTPGVLGENLSAAGLTEAEVCVGDVLRIGTVVLQVSQPRRPCWKIDHRLDSPGLNRVVVEHGCPGWYARVRTPGELAVGDDVVLLERPAPQVTLARLLRADRDHRPDPRELAELARTPGLTPAWADRLVRRAGWLRDRA